MTLDGTQDPLKPGGTKSDAPLFVAAHEHRVLEAGHNLPQEKPRDFADAVSKVRSWLV